MYGLCHVCRAVPHAVLVKMERRPFAAGAMRECFALKKLSTFSSSVYMDWRKAPNVGFGGAHCYIAVLIRGRGAWAFQQPVMP
jgi:hypothetical protein